MNKTLAHPVTTDKLETDVKEVLHDVDALLRATAGDLNDKAREARQRLTPRVEALKDRLAELQEAAKEKIVAGAKQADQTIRAHPYESIGIAFGVGLLVGFLVTRK